MKSIIAGIFRDQESAQSALSDLLASGLSHQQINIRNAKDWDIFLEQFPNTVVRPRKEDEWLGNLFRSLTGKDDEFIWEKAYDRVMSEGQVALMVNAANEETADRTVEILNRHFPLDVEELYALPEVEEYFANRGAIRSSGNLMAHDETAGDHPLQWHGYVKRRGNVYVLSRKNAT